MPLRNALIDPAQLPETEPLRLVPVDRAYPRYRALALLLPWSVGLAAAHVLLPRTDLAHPALAFWPVVLVLVLASHLSWAWLEARSRAWGLREHDLLYASGLLVRRLTVLPLDRVQHIESRSGPLERAFGLERLICFTAGGLSADLVVSGLTRGDARRARQHLLTQIRERVHERGPPSESLPADDRAAP